jgi:hypothetical protein
MTARFLVLAGVGTGRNQDASRSCRASYYRGQHCAWQAPRRGIHQQGGERNLIERLWGPVVMIDRHGPHSGDACAD